MKEDPQQSTLKKMKDYIQLKPLPQSIADVVRSQRKKKTKFLKTASEAIEELEKVRGDITNHLNRQVSAGWLSRSMHEEIQQEINSSIAGSIAKLRSLICLGLADNKKP